MAVHNWQLVAAGIFHDFHHAWIEEIKRSLNSSLLSSDYYALAEQFAGGFGPDVLTLQAMSSDDEIHLPDASTSSGGLLLAPARLQLTCETDMEFYRRKQNSVVIRHVSGDRVVAVVEIVSRGNKATHNALRSFVAKASEFLDQGIHLLIIDLHPPGKHDPQGIHAAIWDEIAGEQQELPPDKPLIQVAYESALTVKAYSVPLAVGDSLTDMPVFLEPNAQVPVPLDDTYQRAFAALPRRWQRVLQPDQRTS